MVEIDPETKRGIEKVSDDRRRRTIEQAGRFKVRLDQRNAAEAILGEPIDDAIYDRLRSAHGYKEIIEAALDAGPPFNILETRTIRALNLISRPSAQEHNFVRRFREHRDKRPEL